MSSEPLKQKYEILLKKYTHLKKNDDIIKSAVENAQHIVYITDPNGIIEYVNSSFTTITGFSKEEVLGHKSNVLQSGKMSDDYYERLWGTISRGKHWEEEIINNKKDGTLYYAYQIITPIFDDDGQIIKFIAIQNDITDKKRAEEKVKQLSLEYEAIFNNVQDAVFLVNVDEMQSFRFLRLNPEHERLTGFTTETVRVIFYNPLPLLGMVFYRYFKR